MDSESPNPEGQADEEMRTLDEREAKARLDEAFAAFIALGYETHIVGVRRRERIDLSLRLEPDGAEDVPIREVQAVADRFRLDPIFDKRMGLVLYPRW